MSLIWVNWIHELVLVAYNYIFHACVYSCVEREERGGGGGGYKLFTT